ncbi:hypothetical protein [Candidatus Nitrospira neomarina]|uniref:HEPN domain-containing protein n=1 Tax=Candidatus Nitrospira neomarina TaxID=3020899 RepID=A0AA96GNY7_9BACT|nr:hypothetical protein [Candidatus Nitrospira neomarina]WNM63695.1 hypothetical protein PQG83_08055 [Candidatus Nitrospira neomarina]
MKIASTNATVAAQSDAQGFWRFAANYLLAARTVEVKIHGEGQLFYPTLQLYGITIELILKAFLLKRGLKLDQMRTLSHNLEKTLILARRRKLGREVKLDPREIAAIHVLSIIYSGNQLRYIVTGSTKVPQLVYIGRAAKELVVGLEYFCTGTSGRLTHAV